MNVLIKSKKIALIASVSAISLYFILDYLKGTGNYAFIDFFRGFFIGIAISTFALFVILLIGGWIKKNTSDQSKKDK